MLLFVMCSKQEISKELQCLELLKTHKLLRDYFKMSQTEKYEMTKSPVILKKILIRIFFIYDQYHRISQYFSTLLDLTLVYEVKSIYCVLWCNVLNSTTNFFQSYGEDKSMLSWRRHFCTLQKITVCFLLNQNRDIFKCIDEM